MDKDVYQTKDEPWYRMTLTSCSMNHTVGFAKTMRYDLGLINDNGETVEQRTDRPVAMSTGNYSLMQLSRGRFYGVDRLLSHHYKLGPGRYRLSIKVHWHSYRPDKLFPKSMRPLLSDPAVHFWTGELKSNEVEFEIRN
jgi:hypothetical protein